MLQVRTLTLMQCYYPSVGFIPFATCPVRSLAAKEDPRACVALSCPDSSVSFNLGQYLRLPLCFMTLTFLKRTSQRLWECPSLQDFPSLKTTSSINATIQSSSGPLFLLPFQGRVSWRIRNHWPSWLAYLSYSLLSLSPLLLRWNQSCYGNSTAIMLVCLSLALTSSCMHLP